MKYQYVAQVINIVDGDTIDLKIDCGFGIFFNERFRLHRINAWEIRGEQREKGLKAKEFLYKHIPPGTHINIETIRDKKGKYGRYLAEINSIVGNINDMLVAHGHAIYVKY